MSVTHWVGPIQNKNCEVNGMHIYCGLIPLLLLTAASTAYYYYCYYSLLTTHYLLPTMFLLQAYEEAYDKSLGGALTRPPKKKLVTGLQASSSGQWAVNGWGQ